MRGENFRGNACGAGYTVPQPDGSIYHRVCSPQSDSDPRVGVPRAQARNENVPSDRQSRDAIAAEGLGAVCLSNSRLVEPAWITAEKKRIAQEVESQNA